MVRARILSALTVALVLGATGCAAPPRQPAATAPPSETPTVTPTPTPTDTPDALLGSVVVIGADGLSVQSADGDEIRFLPYDTAPESAIADLTRIFNAEPTLKHIPGDEVCEPERSEYTWVGMSIHVEGDSANASTFAAGVQKGASNSEIIVQTEHGGRIGGSLAELAAEIPDALIETWDYEGERWDVVMDGLTAEPPAGEESEFWPGVRIHAIDDEIFNIYAPVSFSSDC